MMDWDAVSVELSNPLNPDAIKPPPQGKFGEYVDALHVIREANRIFGFNGWSYEVTRLQQTHEALVETNKGPQMRTSFLCSVKVTVDGTIREGTAVGIGSGKPESAGDVIESAVKEAETDALKRALRTFGNTFGLALYEKDKAAREVGYTPSETAVEVAVQAIDECADMDALQNTWIRMNQSAKHVAGDKRVIAAKDAKKAKLAAKPADVASDGIPDFDQ